MMQQFSLLLLIGSLLLIVNSPQTQHSKTGDKRRTLQLKVGIVDGQVREGVMRRSCDRYGNKGLSSAPGEGIHCNIAYTNCLPTLMAIAHATRFTASFPSIHGVRSNDFYTKASCKGFCFIKDSTVQNLADSYLRLVSTPGDFFYYLDRKSGKEQYIIFLSADDTATHNPYFLSEYKIPAGTVMETKSEKICMSSCI